MSHKSLDRSTTEASALSSSLSVDSISIKKRRGKGSWPQRKITRITPQQKALLIERFFFQNKKIKDAAKELKINYCTAKTIVYTYRKKNSDLCEPSSAPRCEFRPLCPSVEFPLDGIVSTIGGAVTSEIEFRGERSPPVQQIRYNFDSNESFVEKFLVIKEVEQELETIGCPYMMEFQDSKAIFWCQQSNDDIIS